MSTVIVLGAMVWAAAGFAQAAQSPPLLVPELRLERVARLAQAYGPLGRDALVCPETQEAVTLDGDLGDWSDPNGAGRLRFQKEADFGVNLQARWDIDIFVRAISIALFLGILGGLYPAFRATRLQPVEALRYE